MTTNELNTKATSGTDTPTADPILVLGATGKTGRRVAERLIAQGHAVRAGSRSAAIPFDWTDRGTWAAAVRGVRAVYISYQPDLAAPKGADTVGDFAELAVAAGVRRLVLLSGRGEPEAQAAEARVAAAGADWTVVRASFFAQNFDEGDFLGPLLDGELALPVGDIGEPFVHADDIADVAVAALTGDTHAGRVYEVTGPRLLSFAGAVAEIAAASGRDIAYAQVPLTAYTAVLAEHGVPADVIEVLTTLFGEVLDGRNAYVGDGVLRALGRAPRDFADYTRENAARGAWQV